MSILRYNATLHCFNHSKLETFEMAGITLLLSLLIVTLSNFGVFSKPASDDDKVRNSSYNAKVIRLGYLIFVGIVI